MLGFSRKIGILSITGPAFLHRSHQPQWVADAAVDVAEFWQSLMGWQYCRQQSVDLDHCVCIIVFLLWSQEERYFCLYQK